MTRGPLISVVVPAYNAAGFLPEAFASVCAQEYQPLEIFVVDDGSTDNTAEVVRSMGLDIRYLRQNNAGPAAARNHALRLASGEFVAFLDADDQWPAGKLELQLARFSRDPALEVVCGRIQYLSLEGAEEMNLRFEGPERTLSHINLGCGLFRRSVFDKVGPFDETLRFSEDHDWFLRARELGVNLVILRAVTLLYRLHATNMTRGRKADDFQLTEVFRRSILRRRQAGLPANLKPWSAYDDTDPA
ncbi:MAG: glycosyltransferase family A protein [Bryobacteraceae bacterium]|jgi:glycosyltransferase involved in cell wall biosynthesis